MFRSKRAAKALELAERLATRVPSIGENRRAHAEAVLQLAKRAGDEAKRLGGTTGDDIWASAMQLVGEYEHRLGRSDVGLGCILAGASIYWMNGNDEQLSDAAVKVSRIYSHLGDSQMAAQFAIEALDRRPPGARPAGFYSWLYGVLLSAGYDDMVKRSVEQNDVDDLDEPQRSLLLIVAHRVGARRLTRAQLLHCLQEIDYLPSAIAGVQRVLVATDLAKQGHRDEAIEMLRRNLLRLRDEDEAAWSVARNKQILANYVLSAGDPRAALDLALDAWVIAESSRALVGAAVLRSAIHGSFGLARSIAMRAAVELKEYSMLAELLEGARLQSEPSIVGASADLDRALATGEMPAPRPRNSGRRVIDADSAPGPWGRIADDVLSSGGYNLQGQVDVRGGEQSTLEVARVRMRGEALHLPLSSHRSVTFLAARDAAGLATDDLWWHTWIEREELFWTLSTGNDVSGGIISLGNDADLSAALGTCAASHGRSPIVQLDEQPGDLASALRRADTFDEFEVSLPLARLLPQPLRTALQAHSQSDPLALAVSLAPELSVVPWPIVPIAPATDAQRLIEVCTLQYLPSALTLVSMRRGDNAPAPVPFKLSCDYVKEDDQRDVASHPKGAEVCLGTPKQSAEFPSVWVARLDDLVAVLRRDPPGASGLAFFRTHYKRIANDPLSSGLELQNGRAESGMFFVTDQVHQGPIIPLPSRVIFSCCSTSPAADRGGGETLGLVAGSLRSGAVRVVATGVDVDHVPFTDYWDDLLIAMMIGASDHAAGLRLLQLRMLNDWRMYSLRGGSPRAEVGAGDPLVTVWAYYHAYGRRRTGY
jgi:tetratricopeptide (TPR) repeat protein